MPSPPPIPNRRARPEIPPPPRPGQSGTIARVTPGQPDEQTPTEPSRTAFTPYQALLSALDGKTTLEALGAVELVSAYFVLTPESQRLLLETAANLPKRER